MPLAEVQEAFRLLIEADYQYSAHQTTKANLDIVHCQQLYYALLSRHLRTLTDTTQQDITVRRAEILLRRANHNKKRLPYDLKWQAMALHQIRRARNIRNRALALRDIVRTDEEMEALTTPTQTPNPQPTPTKRKRTKHPITRRYVYIDEE